MKYAYVLIEDETPNVLIWREDFQDNISKTA